MGLNGKINQITTGRSMGKQESYVVLAHSSGVGWSGQRTGVVSAEEVGKQTFALAQCINNG